MWSTVREQISITSTGSLFPQFVAFDIYKFSLLETEDNTSQVNFDQTEPYLEVDNCLCVTRDDTVIMQIVSKGQNLKIHNIYLCFR